MTVDEIDRSPTYANMKSLGFPDYYVNNGSNSPEDLYRDLHGNMAQFREPPPYPGHSKQLNSQPGLRQSFSGSETSTDISLSSTENLSSSQRQEPQGEETQAQTAYSYDMSNTEYSILERLGMPTSAMDLPSQNTPAIYVTESKGKHGPHYATVPNQGAQFFGGSSDSGLSGSTSSSKVMWQDSPQVFDKSRFQNVPVSSSPSSSHHSAVSNYSNTTLYANYPVPYGAMDMQYAGGHMFHNYPTSLPPPPDYPGEHLFQSQEAKRSYETIVKPEIPGSRSQPDLTRFYDSTAQKRAGMFYPESENGSQQSIEQSFGSEPQYQGAEQIAAQATKMVEVLSDENRMLREKLTMCDRKVSKLQKFELEIQKVHEAYESLVKSSKKREMLEQTMKKKMAEEIKRLKSQNSILRDKLEAFGVRVTDDQLAVQAEEHDSSMPALLAKYKELLAVKERQDVDLDAHEATIQEQRSQIEILRNLQAEECRKQQARSDYEEQIEKELQELKALYEKKDQTESHLREKLEKDLEYCRVNHAHLATRRTEAMRDPKVDMQKRLDAKESKILQLEKEIIRWKEQHLEESIRKLKLQGVEDEGRLPVYEQTSTSMDTESLINEAKTEKLKQMGEVYQANCKIAELEAKVKSLSSQLKEKEALLRVYQRSSPMTRSSSVHTLYCSPRHSPRPSLIASGSLSRQDSQDMSTFREFKHKKTGSTSALETSSKMSQEDLFQKIKGLQAEDKGDSETDDDTAGRNIWQV